MSSTRQMKSRHMFACSTSLAVLTVSKLCVEKTVGEDGGLEVELVYLVLKKVDPSAQRFRRIGIARIYVSDFFEQRYGFQSEIEII